jgi:hypothetical protein
MNINAPQLDVISSHSRRFPGRSAALPGTPPQPEPAPTDSIVQPRSDENKPEMPSLDPSFSTIFLPSRFEFYEFSTLAVGRLKGFHQSKFYKAAVEQKDRYVAEALTSVISGGIRAEELTIPDFYFLMYWLRLNNYMRTEMVHNGVCDNSAHVREVREGIKDPKTLQTVEIINKTRLDQVELAEDYLADFDEGLNRLTEALTPFGCTITAPRMYDVIDLDENYRDSPQYKEIAFLADKASCLMSIDGQRTTLRQRIEIVEKLDLDVLEFLEEWRIRCSAYGVKEIIKFKCKECGADVENTISISAHSFL